MFICDTPCTFVQHFNNRCPEVTDEYWGSFNGCFEEPALDGIPQMVMIFYFLTTFLFSIDCDPKLMSQLYS